MGFCGWVDGIKKDKAIELDAREGEAIGMKGVVFRVETAFIGVGETVACRVTQQLVEIAEEIEFDKRSTILRPQSQRWLQLLLKRLCCVHHANRCRRS